MMIYNMKNDPRHYTLILNDCLLYFSRQSTFFLKKKKWIDFDNQIERMDFWFYNHPAL